MHVLLQKPSLPCAVALAPSASQALAADVSRPLTEYQAWAAVRLRHAASKQLLVHMKLEEAASKAEEASEHVDRCVAEQRQAEVCAHGAIGQQMRVSCDTWKPCKP